MPFFQFRQINDQGSGDKMVLSKIIKIMVPDYDNVVKRKWANIDIQISWISYKKKFPDYMIHIDVFWLYHTNHDWLVYIKSDMDNQPLVLYILSVVLAICHSTPCPVELYIPQVFWVGRHCFRVASCICSVFTTAAFHTIRPVHSLNFWSQYGISLITNGLGFHLKACLQAVINFNSP